MKLTNGLPHFLAGAAYPDSTIIGTIILTEGFNGNRAAGFGGLESSVVKIEFAWQGSKGELSKYSVGW